MTHAKAVPPTQVAPASPTANGFAPTARRVWTFVLSPTAALKIKIGTGHGKSENRARKIRKYHFSHFSFPFLLSPLQSGQYTGSKDTKEGTILGARQGWVYLEMREKWSNMLSKLPVHCGPKEVVSAKDVAHKFCLGMNY